MRQGKRIRQGYSFFWGVFLLLVISVAISVHAGTPLMKEGVLFKDTLKNKTLVTQSPKRDSTLVIRDYAPIRTNEPLFIVNKVELPSEIFAALNPDYIESIEIFERCFGHCNLWNTWYKWGYNCYIEVQRAGKGRKGNETD